MIQKANQNLVNWIKTYTHRVDGCIYVNVSNGTLCLCISICRTPLPFIEKTDVRKSYIFVCVSVRLSSLAKFIYVIQI